MTTVSGTTGRQPTEARQSWVPMIAIALGQVLMSFNVASLPVAMGGMVKSFNVPPTAVATGIVMYSMLVAGFVMLGAKLNQRFVRFYNKLTPRQIGPYGFILCTIGLLWLALVVHNDWSAIPVLAGFVIFGIGQGSLVALVFNVLVTASPKELAGDVGSLRGTTNNLAAAVGTAVAGALLVGLLSAIVLRSVADNPKLPPEIQAQVNLDNVNFISNDRLQTVLEGTSASPAQIAESVRINTNARLRALKIGLVIMAGIAMLAIIPAQRLPNYISGELPDPSPMTVGKDR